MNYRKPEITVSGSALSQIQGSKGLETDNDGNPFVTISAYEADE